MEAFQAEFISLLMTVLTICTGIATKYLVSFLKKKGLLTKLEANKELVKIAVEAVEQTYKTLHGEEKFNMAKMEIIKLMQEKKINISEKEIDLLIESMVKEMKDTTKVEAEIVPPSTKDSK